MGPSWRLQLKLHPAALDTLQALRDRLGKPLIVRSTYRSPEHNRAVDGAKASKHMDGTAFDIAKENHDPAALEAAAREVGFLGFGYYPRSGFMHVDLGSARQWGAGDERPAQTQAVTFQDTAIQPAGILHLGSNMETVPQIILIQYIRIH